VALVSSTSPRIRARRHVQLLNQRSTGRKSLKSSHRRSSQKPGEWLLMLTSSVTANESRKLVAVLSLSRDRARPWIASSHAVASVSFTRPEGQFAGGGQTTTAWDRLVGRVQALEGIRRNGAIVRTRCKGICLQIRAGNSS
jgi:hypothetical protein